MRCLSTFDRRQRRAGRQRRANSAPSVSAPPRPISRSRPSAGMTMPSTSSTDTGNSAFERARPLLERLQPAAQGLHLQPAAADLDVRFDVEARDDVGLATGGLLLALAERGKAIAHDAEVLAEAAELVARRVLELHAPSPLAAKLCQRRQRLVDVGRRCGRRKSGSGFPPRPSARRERRGRWQGCRCRAGARRARRCGRCRAPAAAPPDAGPRPFPDRALRSPSRNRCVMARRWASSARPSSLSTRSTATRAASASPGVIGLE